jgi:hypothetical protein
VNITNDIEGEIEILSYVNLVSREIHAVHGMKVNSKVCNVFVTENIYCFAVSFECTLSFVPKYG